VVAEAMRGWEMIKYWCLLIGLMIGLVLAAWM
jgi:hypothetical protein